MLQYSETIDAINWSWAKHTSLNHRMEGDSEGSDITFFSMTTQSGCLQARVATTSASVEHHGVQPTGCMGNEPEPSRGAPYQGRPTNPGSTLPRAAHLDGGVIIVFASHSGSAPASPDMRPPPVFVLHAYQPPPPY